MSKCVIVIPAFEADRNLPYLKYCLKTWEWWCRRWGIPLYLMDSGPDVRYSMRPTWRRYAAFRYLDKLGVEFDYLALVDADTMVSWRCPKFFQLARGDFSAVRDIKRSSWVRASLRGYAPLFSGTNVSRKNYINAGFMICEQKHRTLFENMLTLYENRREEMQALTRNLSKGSDQTPLNYILAGQDLSINYLPQQFNLMHLVPQLMQNGWLLSRYPVQKFLEQGYIWHFIGLTVRHKAILMKRTWERIKDEYYV
jgi:hypothetical protein